MTWEVNYYISSQYFVYDFVMLHLCYTYFNILNYHVTVLYKNIFRYQLPITVAYIVILFSMFHLHVIHSTKDGIMLYNILLINQYIGNITTKCHSKSMGDNRDPTLLLHQEISSLPVSILPDTRCF